MVVNELRRRLSEKLWSFRTLVVRLPKGGRLRWCWRLSAVQRWQLERTTSPVGVELCWVGVVLRREACCRQIASARVLTLVSVAYKRGKGDIEGRCNTARRP